MTRTRIVSVICGAALLAAPAVVLGQLPEKPDLESPSTQKPAAQKPAAEKPAPAKPATQKPATQKPAAQKPVPPKPSATAATFPAEPPKPGTPRDFKVPEPKGFTLDNGPPGGARAMGDDAEGPRDAEPADRQRLRES